MRISYKTVDDKLDGFLGSYSDPVCKYNQLKRDVRM